LKVTNKSIEDMEIITRNIDHLGIVAGTFDELSISEVLDEKLPKNRQHKCSHSTIVKAMVLNGLGYTERRLYLFPSYFNNLPTERLLGRGILPEDINEDTVGRTLDRIYEYGPTKLFSEIALKVMKKLSVEPLLLHLDTTSFSVEGGYEGEDGENAIEITFGYPKDGRWDLKQFILSMATNQYGMPLFEEIHSGNKSDKEIIQQTFKKLKEELRTGIDKVYYIADSSFYTEDNIKEVGNDVYWITRVPSTIKMAKDLLKEDLEMVQCEDTRYSLYETRVKYGGIEQRWIVVDSKEMKEKKEDSFNKEIEEDREKVEKELMHLRNREFYCEADAIEEANRWIEKHPWYRFKELKIKEKLRKSERRRGRPRKGEELDRYYLIEGEIEVIEGEIEKEREKLGRFIIATNEIDTEVSGEEILKYYKDQKYIEGGFRFLKDKSFRVSEVYLKKEERIAALLMVMVLTLLVYTIAEWKIRRELARLGESIPNQKGKPTQRPTMKWVFQFFRGISEVRMELMGEEIMKVTNLREVPRKILSLMGKECEKYYN